MRFEELFVIPHTAKYEIPRKIKKEILLEQGRGRIKACLFKMAFSINESGSYVKPLNLLDTHRMKKKKI